MMDYHQNQRARWLNTGRDIQGSSEISQHRKSFHEKDQENRRDGQQLSFEKENRKAPQQSLKRSKATILKDTGRRSQDEENLQK